MSSFILSDISSVPQSCFGYYVFLVILYAFLALLINVGQFNVVLYIIKCTQCAKLQDVTV